jgi:hypothetical protein
MAGIAPNLVQAEQFAAPTRLSAEILQLFKIRCGCSWKLLAGLYVSVSAIDTSEKSVSAIPKYRDTFKKKYRRYLEYRRYLIGDMPILSCG